MKPNIYSNPSQKEKPPTPRKSTLLFGENSFVAEEGMGFSPPIVFRFREQQEQLGYSLLFLLISGAFPSLTSPLPSVEIML